MKKTILITVYLVLALAGFLGGRSQSNAASFKEIKKTIEGIGKEKENIEDAGAGALKVIPLKPSMEPVNEGEDGGLPEYRALPIPDAKGGTKKHVVIIEIHDIIDMGLSAHVERVIEQNSDAAALILDINTPGGRVDAAIIIRDAIMNAPKTMRTVAFIHPRAISAGAFISYACDLILIAPGGTMGAATPISLEGGQAKAVGEKMVSYFRTEMAATARAKGRRGDIAEAMVDPSIEIDGLIPAGKLLTIDTDTALKYKVADAKAATLDEVLAKLALGGAVRNKTSLTWAEKLARIFTHPVLSGILMSIGVLGIIIELYQPGFGLPGIVGVTSLIIFFAGHLVVNLAGWEEIVILSIGAILLFVEVFVIPGFGIAGILGTVLIAVSFVMALIAMPFSISFSTGELVNASLRVFLSLGAAAGILIAALVVLPKTRLKNPLVLKAGIFGNSAGGLEGAVIKNFLKPGITGVAHNSLRPSGSVMFNENKVDVISDGEFINKGEKIKIIKIRGNRVVVRKVK